MLEGVQTFLSTCVEEVIKNGRRCAARQSPTERGHATRGQRSERQDPAKSLGASPQHRGYWWPGLCTSCIPDLLLKYYLQFIQYSKPQQQLINAEACGIVTEQVSMPEVILVFMVVGWRKEVLYLIFKEPTAAKKEPAGTSSVAPLYLLTLCWGAELW